MPDQPKPGNFYTGGLDRVSHLRKDPDWLAERRAHPTSRFIPLWRGQNLIIGPETDAPRAQFVPLQTLGIPDTELTLLGTDDQGAYFAYDLSHLDEPPAALIPDPQTQFLDLRRVGPLMPRGEASMLAYARGMAYWHQRHRFCGVCGHPTRADEAGHVLRCTNEACATPHFPRTDPAVIMLVHDCDRCLLGRQKVWAPGMYSTLAGFVEPGESLEEAVAREVYEETRVTLDSVTYHSSQPWPFPASLMLGFHARAKTTDVTVDLSELEDARWYEKSWLLSHVDDETFRLPRKDSIARRLMEDWLGR